MTPSFTAGWITAVYGATPSGPVTNPDEYQAGYELGVGERDEQLAWDAEWLREAS